MNREAFFHASQEIIQKSLDMVFPPRCAGCGSSGFVLCAGCMRQIHSLCHSPGRTDGNFCQQHQRSSHPSSLTGLQVLGSYQDPLRKYIHALKFNGNIRLAEPLGHLLAQAYITYGMQADAIIPVPLHRQREQQRGYNQSHLLAKNCARHIGLGVHDRILMRHRDTAVQTNLHTEERHQNVTGAFRCTSQDAGNLMHGRTILLIDDVCTTGATLAACASPLLAAGAKAVYGLALARPILV